MTARSTFAAKPLENSIQVRANGADRYYAGQVPQYFLHLSDRLGRLDDPEGDDFRDVESAYLAAVDSARCLMAEDVRHGSFDAVGSIAIADASGRVMMVVRFDEAVSIRR